MARGALCNCSKGKENSSDRTDKWQEGCDTYEVPWTSKSLLLQQMLSLSSADRGAAKQKQESCKYTAPTTGAAKQMKIYIDP